MLSSIGVSRDECYLTYAIKYREDDRGDWDDYWFELQVSGEYPDERDSPDEEGFRPYLLREVLTVSPRVILSFGGLATRTLLRTDESISELRGSLHTLCLNGKEFSVVPTFRPGLLLELPEKKNEVFSDLRLVMDCLASRNVGQE
jgi:uracil-DNA glycosylase family 4